MKNKAEEQPIERGSGNIFADLGYADPEVHQMKVYLVLCIEEEIKRRELTQSDAGKLMGISQPKLSLLLKGQVSDCTIDRLIRYLSRLDQKVTLLVGSAKKSERKATKPATQNKAVLSKRLRISTAKAQA
jgi:predicted XRE-type DNA-binding protein